MLTPITKILFATTLDASTRAVTRMAASLAVQYKAQVVLVHSLEPLSPYGQALIEQSLPADRLKEIREEGKRNFLKQLEEKITNFFHDEMVTEESHQKLLADIVVQEEYPEKLILETAKAHQVDLIVMGTQHRHGLRKVFLGSTARKVMDHTEVPVLIVPLD